MNANAPAASTPAWRRSEDPEAVTRFLALVNRRQMAPWERIGLHETCGAVWKHPRAGLRVIESVLRYDDGRYWHHVSVSRASRLPDWGDVKSVREIFIGLDVEAYMVLPPETRWVNDHPHVLHLWRCLDELEGCVLPDFRISGTI